MTSHDKRIRARVWITRYALTKGIIEIDAEIVDDKYASVGRLFTQHFARSSEDALKVAEEMRLAKVKRLRKQADRLAKLKVQIVKGTP